MLSSAALSPPYPVASKRCWTRLWKKRPSRLSSDVSITARHEFGARFTAQYYLCHPGTGLLQLKGPLMAKGNNRKRGNKEAKKPKQEKPKVSATANSLAGKLPLAIGGKKVK